MQMLLPNVGRQAWQKLYTVGQIQIVFQSENSSITFNYNQDILPFIS